MRRVTVYRAHERGFIDDARYRALQIQMSKWRRNEPGGFQPATGTLFPRLVERHGGTQDVAKRVGVNPKHLGAVLNWSRLRLVWPKPWLRRMASACPVTIDSRTSHSKPRQSLCPGGLCPVLNRCGMVAARARSHARAQRHQAWSRSVRGRQNGRHFLLLWLPLRR
jgi:hypothetical protein